MRTLTIRRTVWAAMLIGSAAGAPVAAQSAADEMSAKAASLYGRPSQFGEAGEKHLQAASLREPGDPRRVKDLEMAGRLFIYAGRTDEGVDALAAAARTAVVVGDLAKAGGLYLDAAFVSAGEHRTSMVRQYVEAARWVAEAPMLPAPERAKIRRRMADLELDRVPVGL